MKSVLGNHVAELTLTAAGPIPARPDTLTVSARFTAPDGSERTVPAFWDGGRVWKIRYSSPQIGLHRFETACENPSDGGLHGLCGSLEVTPYTGENPLYVHGGVGHRTDPRILRHADGTPFFWLADTWWMAFCDRIDDAEFAELAADRAGKGFSVIQIIAGLYPDMEWYDPRGKNAAGYPWTQDFDQLNPAYFDAAERRIAMAVEAGLMPCIVGSWGYFMKTAGKEVLKRHWRNLIARFAAYPVSWCIAGEANMAFYDEQIDPAEHLRRSRADWGEMTRFVRAGDSFGRMVTIHPTQYGHEQIDDASLLDLDMLQTGHGGYPSLGPTMQMMGKALACAGMPVIDSEVCYEGICGSSFEDVQRYAFLSCIFLGACGHTYGANGIWQLNGRERPYGPSPHGAQWGERSWAEAAALPGSGQIGACKKYLTGFAWERFESHPEWVESPCGRKQPDGQFAMGIPGELVLVFKPNFGGSFFGELTVKGLTPGGRYRHERFDPVKGTVQPRGEICADENGSCRTGRVTAFQDWIYTFTAIKED